MKKYLLTLVVIALSLTTLSARTYQLKDFNSLDISSIYEVTVEKSNTWKVEVEASADMEQYLDVRTRGTVLVLDVNNHRTLAAKKGSYIKAHICMPEIISIEMSGVSKLTTDDKFVTKGKFLIEMSGVSVISKLNVDAGKVNIEQSGVSKVNDLKLKTKDLYLEISGTGQMNASGWADNAVLDISGAAKLEYDVKSEMMSVELSGAAKAKVDASELTNLEVDLGGTSVLDLTSGNLDDLFVDASGASTFNGQTAVSKSVRAEASGASKVNVAVSEYLDIEASGASHVTFVERGDLKLNNVRTGAAASVVRMN